MGPNVSCRFGVLGEVDNSIFLKKLSRKKGRREEKKKQKNEIKQFFITKMCHVVHFRTKIK